jgi:pimeloyl-ACP methyl ester carboxylesterase
MNLNLFQSNNSGQPVFFQHGLCGDASQTREAFPHDQRFQLHTLECRGHGASDPGPFDALAIKTFADDVAESVEAQNTGPLILGGISMGAAIALHLAVHKPQRVKALVLARPAWVTEDAPNNMQPNAEVGKLLANHAPEVAKIKFLASPTAKHLAKTAPDNLTSMISFFHREPIGVTSALLTRISADGPGVTETQVHALRIPTLIIATEQDAVHPMGHALKLHALITQSRVVKITPKGVDKAAYISEFRSALLKFFEENI